MSFTNGTSQLAHAESNGKVLNYHRTNSAEGSSHRRLAAGLANGAAASPTGGKQAPLRESRTSLPRRGGSLPRPASHDAGIGGGADWTTPPAAASADAAGSSLHGGQAAAAGAGIGRALSATGVSNRGGSRNATPLRRRRSSAGGGEDAGSNTGAAAPTEAAQAMLPLGLSAPAAVKNRFESPARARAPRPEEAADGSAGGSAHGRARRSSASPRRKSAHAHTTTAASSPAAAARLRGRRSSTPVRIPASGSAASPAAEQQPHYNHQPPAASHLASGGPARANQSERDAPRRDSLPQLVGPPLQLAGAHAASNGIGAANNGSDETAPLTLESHVLAAPPQQPHEALTESLRGLSAAIRRGLSFDGGSGGDSSAPRVHHHRGRSSTGNGTAAGRHRHQQLDKAAAGETTLLLLPPHPPADIPASSSLNDGNNEQQLQPRTQLSSFPLAPAPAATAAPFVASSAEIDQDEGEQLAVSALLMAFLFVSRALPNHQVRFILAWFRHQPPHRHIVAEPTLARPRRDPAS